MNEELETQAALLAEQLQRSIDRLRADIRTLTALVEHNMQMADHRLGELEGCRRDHEGRLRKLQEASTQFRFLVSLTAGGGLLSAIALLQTLLK